MIQNDLRDTLQTIANSVGDLYSRVAQLEASPFSVVSGGGGGAPDNAQYLTLALNANLTQERRFVPAARLSATDSGANADYTLDLANSGVVAAAYGSATQVPTFTVDAYGRLTVAANVAISGVPPVVHNVLDSTYHGDVLTGAITRGDLLYGNATPKIARLPIGGITGSIITRDATDVLWSTYALAGTAGQTYTFPAAGGTLPGGSGAASYVAYWSGANTLTGAATFAYQTGASPNVTVQAANAAHIPLVVKGAAAQSVDVFEVQTSTGAVRMALDAAGNLGIGKTPDYKLHLYLSNSGVVASAVADDFVMEANSGNGISILSGNASIGNIYFGDADDNDVGQLAYDHATNIMRFRAGANYTMYVNSTGVGIGNAVTPTALLHLVGKADTEQLIIKANSIQNDDILQIQNSSGTVLANITPRGGALFSDKVIFTQTDGNEYIDSLADGYMDYGATTAHRLSTSSTTAGINVTLSLTALGSGAAGDGGAVDLRGKSSTTAAQEMARVQWLWYEATHATRKADLVLSAYDTVEREFMRGRGNGSAAALAFYGGTPVVRGAALTAQLTTITHTAPGAPDYAIQDLVDSSAGAAFGFATKDEGNTVLSVIANLQTRVAELEARLNAATGVNLIA